ncbi:MAG: ABC transporter permease [Actinobacteria bacterium]|nr:ABC transporter permease [Actinomycetota bacterium]
MKAFFKLTYIELKLYLREPMATFFTLAYAPMILILFGFIYGNEPTPFFGGRGFIDIAVPSYIGLIIASVGLMSVPISTAEDREKGILRRFRTSPLSPVSYLFANVLVYTIMTLIGVLLLIIIGKFVYRASFEGNFFSVLGGLIISMLSFFSFGYLVASIAPTSRTAQVIGMVVAFPMMFLSGAGIPLEVLPDRVTRVSKYLPLTHVVTFMRGLWIGDSWFEHSLEIYVLVGVLIVGTAISTKIFKWE